jgi:hypothetical protein
VSASVISSQLRLAQKAQHYVPEVCVLHATCVSRQQERVLLEWWLFIPKIPGEVMGPDFLKKWFKIQQTGTCN